MSWQTIMSASIMCSARHSALTEKEHAISAGPKPRTPVRLADNVVDADGPSVLVVLSIWILYEKTDFQSLFLADAHDCVLESFAPIVSYRLV